MAKSVDQQEAGRQRAGEGFIDRLTADACANRCMGVAGNSGGCCQVRERDYVIGPLAEGEIAALLADLADHALPLTRSDVVIDFEEGRAMFPERSLWQDPGSYPVMRIVKNGTNNPCRFYDGKCMIHDVKPGLCRRYRCDWLKKQIELVEQAPPDAQGRSQPAPPSAR